MPVHMRCRGRRHTGIGDRFVLRKALPAHLGALYLGRRGVDPVRLRLEHRAVVFFRRILADIAATHVASEGIEVTVERRTEATTTA